MSRGVRQTVTFLVLLALFTVVQLPYGVYSQTTVKRIEGWFTSLGVPFDIGELRLSFPAHLTLEPVGMLLPVGKVPAPLMFDAVDVALHPFSALLFKLSGEASAKVYGGELRSAFQKHIFGSVSHIHFSAERLQLERYPVAHAFAVAGLFGGEGDGAFDLDKGLFDSSGQLRVYVQNGSYDGGFKVGGVVTLPPVRELNLDVGVEYQARRLEVKTGKLSSSLGRVQGKGGVTVSEKGQIQSSDLRIEIELSEEGKKHFGGYLALAAGSSVDAPTESWIATLVRGGNGAFQWKLSPR